MRLPGSIGPRDFCRCTPFHTNTRLGFDVVLVVIPTFTNSSRNPVRHQDQGFIAALLRVRQLRRRRTDKPVLRQHIRTVKPTTELPCLALSSCRYAAGIEWSCLPDGCPATAVSDLKCASGDLKQEQCPRSSYSDGLRRPAAMVKPSPDSFLISGLAARVCVFGGLTRAANRASAISRAGVFLPKRLGFARDGWFDPRLQPGHFVGVLLGDSSCVDSGFGYSGRGHQQRIRWRRRASGIAGLADLRSQSRSANRARTRALSVFAAAAADFDSASLGLLVFLVGLRQFDFERGDILLALDFDDLLFVVALVHSPVVRQK